MNTTEPNQFIQGEKVEWKKEFCDFNPSDDYSVKYHLRGQSGGVDITGAADGAGFVFTITSAQSANLAAGDYFFQAFAELSGEKFSVSEGKMIVKPGLAAVDVNSAFDNRTQAEKDLAAVRAALSGKASNDIASYTINNRQLSRYTIPDLLALETRLVERVRREKENARLKKGGPLFKQVLVRMKDD
jgi:hypothetical protein